MDRLGTIMTDQRFSTARRRVRPVVLAIALLSGATSAFAQASIHTASRPLFLLGVGYSSTTRTTGEFGVFLPLAPVKYRVNPDVLAGYWGLEVEAAVADGGRRLAIGAAQRIWDPDLFRIPAAAELLMSVAWTNESALTGTADSTYVGVEGGVMLLGVRVSAGVAHRVAGPAGPGGTLLMGSIGIQTAW